MLDDLNRTSWLAVAGSKKHRALARTANVPEGSAQYFDVIFSAAHERMSEQMKEAFVVSAEISSQVAQNLLGPFICPLFQRALFDVDEQSEQLDYQP